MNDPRKLADALGSERLSDLADIDRYEQRERYAAAVADELRGFRFADLAKRFDAYGIWFERVQTYEDLEQDPQARHIGAFDEITLDNRTVTLTAHPLRYACARPDVGSMPLAPGCDSREILAERGFSEDEINGLVERSEEHTSELQSLMRISYADFYLKTNKKQKSHTRQ